MTKQSTLGLEALNLSDFMTGEKKGHPIEISLENILEDPNQPRILFDETSLTDLAESIKIRGVKSPISLRSGPDDTYIINHGARRFRASKLAGKQTIPAWIDEDYLEDDQIIENIHRDALTPKEISKWIGRKIQSGKSYREIAKCIGKSAAYVNQYFALSKLPPPIAKIFESEKNTDVTLLNDLATAWKSDPKETEAWIQHNTDNLSRSNVRELKDFIANKKENPKKEEQQVSSDTEQNALSHKIKNPKLYVSIAGVKGLLLLRKRPSTETQIWVSIEGEEMEVDVKIIKLLSLSDG